LVGRLAEIWSGENEMWMAEENAPKRVARRVLASTTLELKGVYLTKDPGVRFRIPE